MGYLVGALLMLLGVILGAVGDYPVGSPYYTSMELMIAGGLLIAAGVATVLMTAGKRSSRADEPSGHIRP